MLAFQWILWFSPKLYLKISLSGNLRQVVIIALKMIDLIFASWASAYFLLGYILQFFFLLSSNYIFFVPQGVSFRDQKKHVDSKRTSFESIILQLLKDYISFQFWIENPLTVNGIIWQSIVCLECMSVKLAPHWIHFWNFMRVLTSFYNISGKI